MRAYVWRCIPYTFQFESYVIGHHIYKEIWTPVIGEKLVTGLEPDNLKHAVKVINDDKTVGHNLTCGNLTRSPQTKAFKTLARIGI